MGSMDELQDRKDTFDSQESDDFVEDESTASPDILSKISAFIDKVEKKHQGIQQKCTSGSGKKTNGKSFKGGMKSYDDVGALDISSNFDIDALTRMFDGLRSRWRIAF